MQSRAVLRSIQSRLPSATGNPRPLIAAACGFIAGAGILNFGDTLAVVSRLPVPESLPGVLSFFERYGLTGSHYIRAVAVVYVAYATVILGLALLMAVTIWERRRWAQITAAVLAAGALAYAIPAGTTAQIVAAACAAGGVAATFTKGAAPWFRRWNRVSERVYEEPADVQHQFDGFGNQPDAIQADGFQADDAAPANKLPGLAQPARPEQA